MVGRDVEIKVHETSSLHGLAYPQAHLCLEIILGFGDLRVQHVCACCVSVVISTPRLSLTNARSSGRNSICKASPSHSPPT